MWPATSFSCCHAFPPRRNCILSNHESKETSPPFLKLLFKFCFMNLVTLCVCVSACAYSWEYVCHSTRVELKGQRETCGSWFSPFIMWVLAISLDHQAWWQVSLPAESPHRPLKCYFILFCSFVIELFIFWWVFLLSKCEGGQHIWRVQGLAQISLLIKPLNTVYY